MNRSSSAMVRNSVDSQVDCRNVRNPAEGVPALRRPAWCKSCLHQIQGSILSKRLGIWHTGCGSSSLSDLKRTWNRFSWDTGGIHNPSSGSTLSGADAVHGPGRLVSRLEVGRRAILEVFEPSRLGPRIKNKSKRKDGREGNSPGRCWPFHRECPPLGCRLVEERRSFFDSSSPRSSRLRPLCRQEP